MPIDPNDKINMDRQNDRIRQEQFNDRLKEQALIKAQVRGISAAERKGVHEQESATADKAWEDLANHANDLIAKGQQGYDSWVAAMSQIVVMSKKLAEALNKSDILGTILTKIYETIAIPIGHGLVDIHDYFRPETPVTDPLPTYQLPLEFTDEDTLDLEGFHKNVKRSDGKPVSTTQLELLDAGIVAWLHENHFQPLPNNKNVFVSTTDPTQQLTREGFNEIRDDPANGLNRFMSGQFQMSFDTPSPRP